MFGSRLDLIVIVALAARIVGADKPGKPPAESAAPSAGATVSAVFPPAVTETFDASVVFPDESQVGFAGATPTGDEALAVATAPAAAQSETYFPLLNSGSLDRQTTNVPRFWGNLAPWFSISSAEFGLPKASSQIPEGCELNQVHLWHRHGARYPSTGGAQPGSPSPALFASKLRAAVLNGTGFTATGDLEFLNKFTFKLGGETLTPFGRQQVFDLGVAFRVRYGDLLKNFTSLPVFRTTSEDRMVASASNFAAGFFGIPEYLTDYHQLIVVESPGFNNTGAPFETCVNSNLPVGNAGFSQGVIWAQKYLAKALPRLQAQIQGVELDLVSVFSMQQMCAYETVALGYSAFCDLFTEEEWRGYSYANDLQFWYSNAFGSPVAAAQGIGYVQELVARLTQTRIQTHNSTTNGTIDDSPITMPLDQSIYVDATHDTVLANLITALNLTSLAAGGALPNDHIPANQTFFVNRIAPFASNLVAQVMSCPAPSAKPSQIRFVLNDGVVPATGIKGCKPDPNGLCPLDTFVAAMKQQISEVDFSFDCLANYTVADITQILDGRPPVSVRPKEV